MTSKILVADDSVTIQKIVAMAFENEDVVVEGIGNGKAAFEKLRNFTPDVVLADVDMPGYNGFELSRRIKESDEFKSVSVLLLASDFEDFNEGLFLESRADDHISKPFKSDDIVQKVKELLQHPPATLRDGEWQSEMDAPWDDDDEEEEILALSADDVIEEPSAPAVPESDATSKIQADIEKAFAEPGWDDAPKAEPAQPWESEEATPWQGMESDDAPPPWETADALNEDTDPLAEQTPAAEEPVEEKPEDSRDAFASEKKQDAAPWGEPSQSAPSYQDLSYDDAGSGDPLVALSTDDDMEFDLPVPMGENNAAREDAREEYKEPAASFDEREDAAEESLEESAGETEEPEAPARPVSAESQAIDEAIDAVNALKEYSASMLDEPDTGLGIGFQSVEIKGEPETYEDEDFDPTLDLELPSEESSEESPQLNDSDFGIGLGLPSEQNGSLQKVWDEEDMLSGIGESEETGSGELDVVFHPAPEAFRRPHSWLSGNDENESKGADWDFDEAIAPEPEDLLSNLVIHPLPSLAENKKADSIAESPRAFSRPAVQEDSRITEEPRPQAVETPRTEIPIAEPVEAAAPEPAEATTQQGEEAHAMEDERIKEAVNAEVRRVLEQTIGATVQKEISGLSATIVRSVREIVREITPGIAEAVIKAEIEKIKKMEDA